MEATETLANVMVREIRDGAVTAAQDLSKGVVPIILVVALLAPTWYLRGKLAGVENQLSNSAVATVELGKKIETLTPLVHEVATAQARIETLTEGLRTAERDRALLQSQLRDLEKRLSRVEIHGER